jgi:DNA sulfur modification protein DndD
MILEKLTLNNFCLYRGEQTLDLAPHIRSGCASPIVLLGGINGGGKTTILDAIQLVLYGNRARCSKRTEMPYDEFLRHSIHHAVDAADGAGITLTFRYASDGEQHLYEVSRSWSEARGKIRERIAVRRDGDIDAWLSDNWSQIVEEIIPHGIAQLCFFDAEKIRHLAEDESSTRTLGDAIKSLLGLDLAERLVADTLVLEGKLAKRATRSEELGLLERLEADLRAKQAEVDGMVQELGALENLRQKASDQMRKVEEEFSKVGGRHWQEREARQVRLGELTHQVKESVERMIGLAATELPLAIVRELLTAVASRANEERAATETTIFSRLLEERDTLLLEFLKRREVGFDVYVATQDYLSNDRNARTTKISSNIHIDFSDSGRTMLHYLVEHGLAERQATARENAVAYDCSFRSLEALERSLAMTPDDDSVRDVAAQLKTAVAEVAALDQQVSHIERQLVATRLDRDDLDKKMRALRRKVVDEQIKLEEDARLGKLVTRTRDTMAEFLRRATARKIYHLSEMVTESFRFLLRKETLVEKVAISPTDFSITIFDNTSRAIPKSQLSEGEKQIFAIAVLWGLSRASARPLPTIIDTPMGRLDEKHRDQLVSRYFPHASHQTVILSTDTEIDRQYFDNLQPHLARAYHLRYIEMEKRTVAEEGYFWGTNASVDERSNR